MAHEIYYRTGDALDKLDKIQENFEVKILDTASKIAARNKRNTIVVEDIVTAAVKVMEGGYGKWLVK